MHLIWFLLSHHMHLQHGPLHACCPINPIYTHMFASSGSSIVRPMFIIASYIFRCFSLYMHIYRFPSVLNEKISYKLVRPINTSKQLASYCVHTPVRRPRSRWRSGRPGRAPCRTRCGRRPAPAGRSSAWRPRRTCRRRRRGRCCATGPACRCRTPPAPARTACSASASTARAPLRRSSSTATPSHSAASLRCTSLELARVERKLASYRL